MIRPVKLEDASRISEIYNYYILNATVTTEEVEVSEAEILERIKRNLNKGFPWLVYELDGEVAGYSYGRPWRTRSAYRYTVEVSFYLNPEVTAKGIGSQLMTAMLEELKKGNKCCAAMASIPLPNDASQGLCEKFGFKKVAHIEKVGYKFNKWLDLGFWQLRLKANPED